MKEINLLPGNLLQMPSVLILQVGSPLITQVSKPSVFIFRTGTHRASGSWWSMRRAAARMKWLLLIFVKLLKLFRPVTQTLFRPWPKVFWNWRTRIRFLWERKKQAQNGLQSRCLYWWLARNMRLTRVVLETAGVIAKGLTYTNNIARERRYGAI